MKPLSLPVILAASALALAAGGTATPPMGSAAVAWEDIVAKPAKGLSRQVFQAPTATLDELEVHVTTLSPGQAPHPPHKHPDEEIIIIKEGTVEAMVNGESRRLGAGSVIFQAAGQLHTIKNVGDVPAVYHVIKWNSPGMLKARQP
jgi:XRE family transcriptional regulator, regulator of sulfur utilization